jgi:diphthamide synthase subunit DPH2
VNCYISNVTLYGAEMWTLRKVDQEYMESVDVSSRRRLEKISSIDRVKNEGVLQGTKAKRSIRPSATNINANWSEFDSRPVHIGFVVNKFSPSTSVFLFRCHFPTTPYYFIYRAPG